MRRLLALFAKDTAGVAGYWAGAGAIIALGVADVLAGDPLTEPYFGEGDGVGALGFVLSTLAFGVGVAMPAREFRDGSVEFLDALPARRTLRYASALLAGLAPVLVMVGSVFALDTLGRLLRHDPGDLPFASSLFALASLCAAVTLSGYGAGLLLAWLGELAWGVWFVGLFAGLLVAEWWRPFSAYLPGDGTWADLDFVAGAPVPRWDLAAVWLAAGALGALLSWLVYLGPGDAIVKAGSRLRTGVRYAGGCLLYGLALPFLGLLGLADTLQFLTAPALSTQDVGTLRFLYVDDARHTEPLLAQAQALDAQVRGWTGTPAYTVDVEIVSRGQYHVGKFNGGKIRLGPDEGPATLAHELTHAHAFQLAGRALHRHFDHTRFLNEGYAMFVEQAVVVDPVARAEIEATAGAIARTHQADFDRLVEDEERSKELDMMQVYPLGYVFVQALVDVDGPRAPARAISALGKIDGDLPGIALWYTLADRADFDLDRVLEAYDARLRAFGDALGPLPQLTASPAKDEQVTDPDVTRTYLAVADHAATGLRLMCRFRDSKDADIEHWSESGVRSDGRCYIPGRRLANATFDYQLGFTLPNGGLVFLPWATARVP